MISPYAGTPSNQMMAETLSNNPYVIYTNNPHLPGIRTIREVCTIYICVGGIESTL
jgi:hypothetical protein